MSERWIGMGSCCECSWYEDGMCKNPDAEYMTQLAPDDGCTLCDHDAE